MPQLIIAATVCHISPQRDSMRPLCRSCGLSLDRDHGLPHDEFNGGQKVSSLNGAVMMLRIAFLNSGLAAGAVALAAGGAVADDASRWSDDVRLVAGSETAAVRRAGIEIRLKPGWHTYWRYPG